MSPAAAAVAFLLIASPALAQTAPIAPPQDASMLIHMDLSAGHAIKATLEKDFDEAQIDMLITVAHQQAVSITCPGFAVDPDLFKIEMDLIYDDAEGKPREMTPLEKVQIEKKAMLGFGMALGAQLAIGAADEKAYCAAAEQARGATGVEHRIWRLKG